MLYLILAILSSMLVSVVMRLSQQKCQSRLAVLAMNYVMCSLMALLFMNQPLSPQGEGSGFALGLGLVNGALYLGSFMLLQYNIRINGVVLPSTFMKLGIVVPTLMSIFAFGESLTLLQGVGLVAAVAAIWLIGSEKGQGKAKSIGWLLILLAAGGVTDGTSKIYEELGAAALKDHFLLTTFFVALLLCALLCVVKKETITRREIVYGMALGIPNYFSARFLLLSLGEIPAVIAYPTYSVGTIVAVTLAGLLLFREKISKRQMTALIIILAALILLNA
ncbi:MAG: hypothetical protein IJF65_06310 [Clostridia bacterium]|nr:hypothetical protein [Clostridia bacterium]